jgi:Lrp/AsnC family transcriptional regulator for asnA, asnC and gidA
MAHTPGTAIIPGGETSDGSRRSRGDRPERVDRYDRYDRFDRASRDRDRGRGSSRIVLDEISKRIIEQLQQDGRRSYAAIGKAVGLSEAAVRQRVQRLTDAGVMQIVAVTDPMMLGFHRQTMIGIKCEGDLERVADHLAGMDEIDYVVITSGSFDLLVEVVCEDDDQLLEILSRVRMAPTVTSTETFVYLKLRKQTYSWGTR